MIQNLADGIIDGSVIALGAIGLTMMMQLLRFANFSHAELLSIGAFCGLVFDRLIKAVLPATAAAIEPLSLTWALAISIVISMVLTGIFAALVDQIVFKRIRKSAGPLSMVFASFGVALVLRNVIGLIFGLKAQLYSADIVFAVMVSADPLLLIKPDQVFVLFAALFIMFALHLVYSRTTFGYSLRAVAENPSLAQVAGVNLSRVVVGAWLIGGGLAAAAGIFHGLSNHISSVMGHNFLLPVFAGTIVGGIGSIYGAVLGGFIVGIATSLAVAFLPAGYGPALPFVIILIVLFVRPHGLFGTEQS